MLLKWLFTLLAIIWLYQALRPMLVSIFSVTPPPQRPYYPPPQPPVKEKKTEDNDGDYIDYEEIK
ncbi:MAG: hypothetical protein IT262_07355 [Saprospiraceae bacterium]|nr:hypothetical protein [Saprospiraceae bacterium]